MKICIGADHGGYELKEFLKGVLNTKGFDVEDEGCFSVSSVDYPAYGKKVAKKVSIGESKYGILICKSGIGMSIVANRFDNVRAALCVNEEMAKLSRAHNNSNVLVLGSQFVSFELAEQILEVWLSTEFEGGRHEKRVSGIENGGGC